MLTFNQISLFPCATPHRDLHSFPTRRSSDLGLKNPNRPVGSFMFLGPTGVGKTELARALAQFLFGSEGALIRSEEHTSELQSPCNLVCRLLLEKKNKSYIVSERRHGGRG